MRRLLVAMLAVMALAPASSVAKPAFPLHDEPRTVPPVTFRGGDDRERSLADFRGRVVLLNIWATWCVPCRREMPTLDRLQSELGGADFEVVALSIDRAGLPAVEAFYKEIGLTTLGIYVDAAGKASRQLGIVGLPTTILIGRDGMELGRFVGPAEWDSPEMIGFLRQQIERRASHRDQGGTGRVRASIAGLHSAATRRIPTGRGAVGGGLDLPATGIPMYHALNLAR